MKYRVVSVLKDNRPRFLIISDIEEIAILPSKYLKHLDQINASPNTVKSAAFALSYYYNFLQEQTIGLDEVTLLTYIEREIRVLTNQRKTEGRIISAMPLVMLLAMNVVSYSYIEPLYTTPAGRAIMSGALIVMACGICLMEKISSVEV